MILSTPKFLRHEIECHSCREGWTAEQAGAQIPCKLQRKRAAHPDQGPDPKPG